MDKSTSDEKLLKLIEGSGGQKPAQKVGLKPKGKGIFPFPLKFKFRFLLNLQNIDKGLFVVCVGLTLLFLFTIISGASLVNQDIIFPSAKAGAKLSLKDDSRFLSLQDYQNEIKNRDIFLAFGVKAASDKELAPDLSQLVQDLKLVGVIWSSNPEVMIESSKENRTYLLKKGETFSQFKIKDITRSSAILEMESEGKQQEYELR